MSRPEPAVYTSTLLLCVAMTWLIHVVTYLLNTQLPLQIVTLGGTHGQVGWLFAVNTGIAMVLRPQVGGWVDRYGAREVMLAGAGVLVVTMAALNISDTPLALIALMAGLGIALALVSTSGSIVVAEEPGPPPGRGTEPLLRGVLGRSGDRPARGLRAGRRRRHGAGLRGRHPAERDRGLADSRAENATRRSRTSRRVRTAVEPPRGARLDRAHHRHDGPHHRLRVPADACGRAGLGNAAWFFPLMSGCTIATRLFLRRASDQFGRTRVLVPSLVAIALGTALLALPPTIASLVAAAVLLGTGNSMLYPTLVALVVDRAPPAERGLAIGTLVGGMGSWACSSARRSWRARGGPGLLRRISGQRPRCRTRPGRVPRDRAGLPAVARASIDRGLSADDGSAVNHLPATACADHAPTRHVRRAGASSPARPDIRPSRDP